MELYKYQPIDLAEASIRLLRLLKGHFGDEVRVEIINSELEGGIPYEALSYTWGNTSKVSTVIIAGENDRMLPITKNLHEALRYLRSEDTDRILWIDAICINQDNDSERGHQVRQMCSIYEESQRVVVWLGHSDQEIDLAMDFMKYHQDKSNNFATDGRIRPQLWAEFMDVNTQTDVERYKARVTTGVRSLTQRHWFRRTWILQEIASARAAVIICGSKIILARTFARFPSLLGLSPPPYVQSILDVMPGFSRKTSWWNEQRDLRTLLNKFKESEASDERDKIYALLQMSSDARNSKVLMADYSKSLPDLLVDTILFWNPNIARGGTQYSLLLEQRWTFHLFYTFMVEQSPQSQLERFQDFGMMSTETQTISILLFLANNGQCTDVIDDEGRTVLHLAASIAHDNLVKMLLELPTIEVNRQDIKGFSPLFAACIGLEASYSSSDRTVLASKKSSIVTRLLTAGASVNLQSANGDSPLHYVIRSASHDLVQLLIRKGTDVNMPGALGDTPLHIAVRANNPNIIQLLIGAGADFTMKDSTGHTPLQLANILGYSSVAIELQNARVPVPRMVRYPETRETRPKVSFLNRVRHLLLPAPARSSIA